MSKGVLASIFASVLFSGLYYYATLLSPLTGEEIFGWRMVFTAPGATVLLLATREWGQVRMTLRRLREQPLLLLVYVANATMLGAQMWVFMWAPLHGRAMEVTLGYFLLPLLLVLVGRIAYKDRLSRWQQVATVLAALGVANQFLQVGGIAWPTLLASAGYVFYFVCRRQFRIDRHGDSWLEMHLLVPVAVLFVVAGPTGLADTLADGALLALIPGLGLISAAAFSLYFFAMRTLNFSLFGLLGYVEPVLLVIVSLLLGETLAGRDLMTYVPIWCAVGLLVVEGVLRLRGLRGRHRVPVTDPVVG